MKKRTSNVSRRIVSLLMSIVLTLTLVTPAAFAEGDMPDNGQQQEQQESTDAGNGGSGTPIVEGGAGTTGTTPSGDAGNGGSGDVSTPADGKDSENKDDEDKDTEDANKPGEDKKGEENPDGDNKDEQNTEEPTDEIDTLEDEGTTPTTVARTVTLEKWNKNAAYDVNIVIPAAASEPGEGETTEAPSESEDAGTGSETGKETLSNEYTGTDGKIILKLTATEDYKDEAIYIKSSADEVVTKIEPVLGDGTFKYEYELTDKETDITLYYGTQEDFVSAWYTNVTDDKYTIRSAEELAYLAKLVNDGTQTFSGNKIITLAQNIDLSNVCHPADESGADEVNWTPIGNDASHAFAGKFDGNGYTIEKLYINESSVWAIRTSLYKGLFGNNSGVIQNVIVKGDVTINNTKTGTAVGKPLLIKAVGGIVGNNNSAGKVQNCGFYGTVTVQGNDKNKKTSYQSNNNGGVVGTGNAANCWYYTPWVDDNNMLGVCGGTPTNCYHNVPKHTGKKGTLIKSESFGGFAAAAADGLNAYAFENKLPMWSASESALVINMELKYDAVVKLAAGVEGSVVTGKVGFGNNLAQSKLGKNNEPLALTAAEGTGKVYYTLKKPTEGVTITKDDLVGLPAEYTVNAENADEKGVITLYYGTEDELMADLTESGWYYNNTKGDYYSISTSKELRFLATLVNDKHINFSGKTINLTKNIDLSDIEDWTPIGKDTDLPFAGKFNGAGSSYSISGLNGDLFGVVKGSIESVNISGVTGRLVGTLESGGTVKNCMSTAKAEGSDENAAVGGLVGTAVEGATVSSSYYYNKDSMGTRVVGSGKATNCFYLAETSTFGDAEDNGARTAEEFAAGRVTWELNGKANGFKGRGTYLSWGMSDNEPKVPKLARIKVGAPGCVYELTLTKVYAPPAKDIRLEGEDVAVLHDGDTWYAYCVWASNKTFSVKVDTTTLESGDMVTYGTNGEPTKITYIETSTEAAKNAYSYTIGGKIDADISWYVGHENDDIYILKTPEQMFGFAALVNGTAKDKDGKKIPSKNFNGKTVKLDNDIDLSGYSWTPIGLGNGSVFQGTFDGGGHRIKGLFVTSNMQYAGLFGYLKGGTVQKVQVEGSIDATYTSGGDFFVGGIVGYLEGAGTVSNCLSKVDVTATSSNKAVSAGGVVGFAVSGSKINLCWNEGSVQVTGVVVGSAVGGVVGGAATATNCANFGAVTSNCATGGIAGSINEASNCYNLGTVTGAEGMTHNISGGTAVNSYYADIAGKTGIYVKRGSDTTKADTTGITITEDENGKLTYKVTMDGTEYDLVVVLNENTPTAANIEKWISKLSTPYNPVHMTRWDNSPEPGAKEGLVSITYDPGTATVGTAVSDSWLLKEEEESWTFTLKTADDLGFKHENGTFLGWSTQSNAAAPEYAFNASTSTVTPATIEVTKEQKNVTLYAVWKDIWSGSGSEADPYLIPSTEKLKALQTQVNDKGFNYKGKYFAITGTIDLGNENWTPIGNGKASFAGSIEGNGNTITGLYVTEETRAGLFEILGVDGTSTYIRNLTICGQVTVDHGHAGGLTAVMGHGTITLEKITTDVTVSVKNLNYYASPLGSAGGLIGYNVANDGATYNVVKVIKCINKGSIYGVTAGGIAGANNSSNAANQYTLEDCTNEGTVTGLLYAGGILGGSVNSTAIRCENKGTVVATETTGTHGYAGGICATNLRWAERCVNTGDVSGKYAGGIAYDLTSTYGGEAKYCLNKGNITGTRIAAGIVVYGKKVDVGGIGGISFSYNLGEIKGSTDAYSYGIAQGGTIKNCFTYNEAKHVAISANNKLVTNSYYLADSAGDFPATYGGEWASKDDFASGKVAWGVGGKGEGSQGGTGQDAKLGWWKQDKNDEYPTLLDNPDMSKRYYRTDVDCGTGGEVELTRNASSTVKELSSKEAVYGPAGTSVTIKATPKDNTIGLKSLTWTHNGQTDVLPTKGTTNIVMPAESNVTIHAEFASVGPGGGGGYYYGGSGDGTGTGDQDDEGLQDGLNMDVEYDIKGLVLGVYAEWGSNGGNKSFQKWLEENPNVVRTLLTNSLDNMATAAVGKKTDEAKDLAALLLASLNEHTGVDGKDGDTIAKALQKYIDSGSEEVFSAWLTGGGGMASGTYESIYGQYASSLAALADRLYSKWEASGTSMTFPVWLDSQQVSMDSLSENADEPDTDNTNDPQTSDAPDDVPDGQDTEGGASGNSVWEIIGTVVRENPILVWSIVAVIAALIIVGAVRRYHKVKRDEHDEK